MIWTLTSLLRDAHVDARTTGDVTLTGLSFDPRRVEVGDVFCCIRGARMDGHDLAARALEAGAVALLVEHPVPVDAPQAVVSSVRDAMGPLAAAFNGRPSNTIRVAAVTGTNGKTTWTYLVEAIAYAAGLRPGVIGTIEARGTGERVKFERNPPEAIDLQRTLARFRDASLDVVALEASSIGLDQGRLRGTRFAAVAFTNLTHDHIDEYHGTMERYFDAKAALFTREYANAAAINVDDPYGLRLAGSCTLDVLRCSSRDARADVSCTDPILDPAGTTMRISTPSGTADLRTRLVGRYNVDNVLLAAAVAVHLGIGLDAVARGVESLRFVPGRLERVEAGQGYAVLVDYAHTPDALGHAVRAARALTTGRLIVVFGCGGDRDRGKRPLMGEAATSVADLTVLTSDNPRSEDPRAIIDEIEPGAVRGGGGFVVEPDRRAAIAVALEEARPGDVVLIAGKGHETGQELGDATVPFDDRDVARELLQVNA